MIHGKDLIIKLGNVIVACSDSCEVDFDTDMLEVSGMTDGTTKEYIPKRTSWSIQVSGLLNIGSMESFINKIRTTLTAQFSDGTKTYQGTVFIKKLKFAGKVKSISKYSATFQGSGSITDVQ